LATAKARLEFLASLLADPARVKDAKAAFARRG
jgi:hypothetical protein